MPHKQNLSQRDFIKGAAALVSGLIGLTIALPTLVYLLSPSLRKGDDDTAIELGHLGRFPVGIPTRMEFTRTRVNGWERTAIHCGL